VSTKGSGKKSYSDKPTNKSSALINQKIDYGVKLKVHRVGKHAKGKAGRK
jgi:hypothetical protein